MTASEGEGVNGEPRIDLQLLDPDDVARALRLDKLKRPRDAVRHLVRLTFRPATAQFEEVPCEREARLADAEPEPPAVAVEADEDDSDVPS